MEDDRIISEVCRLSLEKLEKDTREQLKNMNDDELALVFSRTIYDQLVLLDEVEVLGKKFDNLEVMVSYLRDEYLTRGIDINEIEIGYSDE